LAAQGIRALLCERDTPTPVVAHEILRRRAAGGVVVTAGHHLPEYNGIKVSAALGGAAPLEACQYIQERANGLLQGPRVAEMAQAEAEGRGLIERINPRDAYLERLRSLVSLETIREARLKVVVDPLYGSAQGYLDTLLAEAGCGVKTLHGWRDPNFGGRAPDPAAEQLADLAFQVVETSAHLGLATDGDAGRFGLVDADGAFLDANYFLGLLLRHLITTRGWTAASRGRRPATWWMLWPAASVSRPTRRRTGSRPSASSSPRRPSSWAATKTPDCRSRATCRRRMGSWPACWPQSWWPRGGAPGSGRCSRSCTRRSGRS
jgi:phosphomannomutase